MHDTFLEKWILIFTYIFDFIFVYAHYETMQFSQLNVNITIWSDEWIGEQYQLVSESADTCL